MTKGDNGKCQCGTMGSDASNQVTANVPPQYSIDKNVKIQHAVDHHAEKRCQSWNATGQITTNCEPFRWWHSCLIGIHVHKATTLSLRLCHPYRAGKAMGKPNAGSCHIGGAKSRAKENIFSEGQCQLQHIERQQMTITTCLACTCYVPKVNSKSIGCSV